MRKSTFIFAFLVLALVSCDKKNGDKSNNIDYTVTEEEYCKAMELDGVSNYLVKLTEYDKTGVKNFEQVSMRMGNWEKFNSWSFDSGYKYYYYFVDDVNEYHLRYYYDSGEISGHVYGWKNYNLAATTSSYFEYNKLIYDEDNEIYTIKKDNYDAKFKFFNKRLINWEYDYYLSDGSYHSHSDWSIEYDTAVFEIPKEILDYNDAHCIVVAKGGKLSVIEDHIRKDCYGFCDIGTTIEISTNYDDKSFGGWYRDDVLYTTEKSFIITVSSKFELYTAKYINNEN